MIGINAWASSVSYTEEVERVFKKLDSLVIQRDYFRAEKEARIRMLKEKIKHKTSPEERFFANGQLYDEYYVYNSDSAKKYADANVLLSERLGRKDWLVDWKIKRAFIFSATGMLKESLDELQYIDLDQLTPEQKVDYYNQLVYLYSHFGQYQGSDDGEIRQYYLRKEQESNDSVYAYLEPGHPLYLWHKCWKYRNSAEVGTVIEELKMEVDKSSFDNRLSAMNAYALAQLYRDRADEDNYMIYISYSAMADIRSCNKDIASLEELGRSLFERGDVDRAYTYINYCFQNAQFYKNRVRIMGISSILDQIHEVYLKQNILQESRLQGFLIIVSILSVVLLAAIIYIYRQMHKLRQSRAELNVVNRQLNFNVKDLSEAHTKLEEANNQLQSLNEQLKEANNLLKESNYVKEEYIGYVFSICSSYINKLDEYRKNINRKIKTNQIDAVKALTDTPTMAQSELKEFYRNFDMIFLHVYPDFVSDFNALLRPEEQIILKEGELLNTELRIYALVRLGINDSVKIAEFLHCSPQTVYNNRLRTRNKAIIPKETFAETVRSLGKMQE